MELTFTMILCDVPILATMKTSGGSTKGPTGFVRPGSLAERTGFGPRTGVVERWNCLAPWLSFSHSLGLRGKKMMVYLESIYGNDVCSWGFIQYLLLLKKAVESLQRDPLEVGWNGDLGVSRHGRSLCKSAIVLMVTLPSSHCLVTLPRHTDVPYLFQRTENVGLAVERVLARRNALLVNIYSLCNDAQFDCSPE